MLTAAQQATLAAVVDAVVPSHADRDAATAVVATALDALPAHKRARLARVLSLLGTAPAGMLLAGRARRFADLPRALRERALLTLGRIAPLRPAFAAFTRLALFGAYAGTSPAGGNPLWGALGYPGPRGDAAGGPDPFPLAALPAERFAADAVVIGSGAGGGVAAALLAAAGLRTVVLEAGPPVDAIAAAQSEAASLGALYLEGGLCSTDDLGVSILAGACLGGGTSVNWSTSLRLPPALAAAWGTALERPAFAGELADAYDAVESRLGVTVATSHNANNAVIADGCAALGLSMRAIPRNARCTGDACGYCGFGCAYGTKQSTANTYLRDAAANGARIFTGVRADRVRVDGGVATGVDVTADDGRVLTIDAPLVVVAAGALRTPGILARSGVRSAHLGKHLHLHPVQAVIADFDRPIEPWHGPMQTALCDAFADLDAPLGAAGPGYGVAIEAAPVHPGIAALGVVWTGADAHAAEMASSRNRAVLIVLTRDRGEGSVGIGKHADVRYTLDPYDAAHLATGVAAAARIAIAAGATGVQSPAALYSAHQMGTARMAARAEDGAIDPEGRVFGIDGLLVADASAFPDASGVNPMLTIMALAHRTVSAALRRRAATASAASGSRAPSRS